MANRTVSVSLKAEIADFMGKMGTAAKGAQQFGDELGGLGKKSPKQLNDVALATGAVGVALLGVAGYAVKTAMEFDKQMSAVGAATNANVADMGRLREAALEAGKATTFSATEAAKGQTELAKAGVSTADILGGGLSGALDLAAAGQMEVADSAELAATAMTQFGLSGKDVPHIADLLAAGAGKAQGSVKDMGMALNQSGLVANQFGLSIEDTTGALAMFAHAGLTGSDAGTSFKQMLLMLANPSKEAAKTMDDLGINTYDASGKFVGMTGLAEQLKTKMSGLSMEQRNAALSTIFGADAIRAASILYKNGAAGVDDWRNKVSDSGYAAEQAAKLTDNLAGDLERLRGSIETVAIEAGSGANGGLRMLVQALDGVVTGFGKLPSGVTSGLTVLAGVGGAGLVAAAGLLKVQQTVRDTLTALTNMGPMGAKAADGLRALAGPIGKLGLIGVGMTALWMGFDAFGSWVEKKHAPVKANIDALTESIQKFVDTGNAVGELSAKYGDSLQKIGKDVTGLTKAAADLAETQRLVKEGIQSGEGLENWNPIDPQAKQRVSDLDEALSGLVKGGGATQAKLFLDSLVTSGALTNEQLSALTGMLPKYTEATGAAGLSSSGLAQGFGNAEQNARTMVGSLQAAIQAGQTLKQVFDQLNGGFINSQQATIAVEQNIDALTEAFKQNGQALDQNKQSFDLDTKAGRENMTAVLAVATSARDLAQAKYEETGSLSVAKGAYDGYIGKLRQTLSQAGMTEGQIDSLVGSIAQMPALKSTTITLNDDATWRIISIRGQLNSLQNRTVTITTKQNVVTGETQVTRGSRTFERWGGAYEHAAAGALREAGTYTPHGAARYAFAEPATQGEAFIPRNGDRLRSLGILSKAASWYGANITAGGSAGRGEIQIHVHPAPGASTGEIVAQVKRELAFDL